jgi:peroxiredoxin
MNNISQKSNRQNISKYFPWALIIAGTLILMTSLAFLIRPPADQNTPVRLGQKLIDFRLPDLNGKLVSLSDYAGKTILVNTCASWCPPCRAEMPDLESFYKEYQDQNFIILAVNVGESSETARIFAENMGLTFPILLDKDYQLVDGLGINSFPTSILVGPDGIVKKIQIGMFLPGSLEKEILTHIEN